MATRAQNAEAINASLGLIINTDVADPKAAVLQSWADRLDREGETVRHEVLSFQLQAALGIEITDTTLDTEQLSTLLERSKTEPDQVRTELLPLETTDNAIGEGGGFAEGEETFEVQVVPAVAAYGGTVTDPEQPIGHRIISSDPVEVRGSQIVFLALKNGTLLKA